MLSSQMNEGLINWLDTITSGRLRQRRRSTILRRLNTIEGKADAIIERLNRD